MCTLSILRAGGAESGYDLWFNRDERLERAPERPPAEGVAANGVRFLAPGDGGRGGTWLMVNECGLTVCVLNDYEAAGAGAGELSRGRLPLACAGCGDAAEAATMARAWADAAGATRLGAFLLVAADERGATRGLGWDGRGWTERSAVEFATSSSYRPAEVRRVREAAHAAVVAGGRTAARLAGLHWAYDPAAGAEAVRMRRTDACTRSVCAVRVRRGAGCGLVYTTVDWTAANGLGARTEAAW